MDGRGPSDILLFEGFRFDLRSGGLFRLDQAGIAAPVAVGSRALEQLGLLVRRNGELVSKLRHILDQNRQNGSCIQTVTGYGYRFTADVTRADPAPPPQTLPPLEHAGGASEDERLYEPRAADPPTVQSGGGPPRPTMPPPRRFSAGVLAGCGKSRDFGKTVMKRARNGNPGLIKSTGYEGAKGDESGWKHHRPTFSAACLGLVRKLPNRPLIELDMGSQSVSDTICCSGDRYRTHQRAVFGGGPVS